jgi:hypothetical protein
VGVPLLAAGAAAAVKQDWFSEHATLIVGVVGIVFSGFVGPTVTGWLTGGRERQKDERALTVSRRDNLREVVDEAAKVLGAAVTNLRAAREAEEKSDPIPKETTELLAIVFPLGQRLRLRLPASSDVVKSYDEAREKLEAVWHVMNEGGDFDAAIKEFELAREQFLDNARAYLEQPLLEAKEAR